MSETKRKFFRIEKMKGIVMSEFYKGPLKVSVTEKHNYCSSTGERRDFKQFWIKPDVEEALAPAISLMSTEYSTGEEEAHYWTHLFAASPKMQSALESALCALEQADATYFKQSLCSELDTVICEINKVLRESRGENV